MSDDNKTFEVIVSISIADVNRDKIAKTVHLMSFNETLCERRDAEFFQDEFVKALVNTDVIGIYKIEFPDGAIPQ